MAQRTMFDDLDPIEYERHLQVLKERCNGNCERPAAECQQDPAPEPPDGTRIEFEHWTDVHAFWRSDFQARLAGGKAGDGGDTWCEYGRTVGVTWNRMREDWGDCVLHLAVRLLVHPDDADKHWLWPTSQRLLRGGKVEL